MLRLWTKSLNATDNVFSCSIAILLSVSLLVKPSYPPVSLVIVGIIMNASDSGKFPRILYLYIKVITSYNSVRFTIRNKKGDIVATGDSPPIMITDDHKTTKPRTPAIRTRRRKPSPLMTPISSRKTSICESDTDSFFPVVDPIQTPYDSPKTPTFFDFPTLEKSIPILNHVFPTNGPCTGGIRITITGDHLHPGLTLMFGHRAAKTLSCTSNMMLCLLPMAETSGPVVLSFKEHPLMRASPIPPLFEYCESGRLDLLQLAIQTVPSMEHTDDMELDLVRVFSTFCGSASTTNLMGQTMLHFAAHLNYPRLMSVLVAKHPSLVDAQDVNGLSPLHMACNSKSTVVIEILLKAGADIGLFSNYGTPIQVALELLSTEEYHDFEKRLANIHTLNPFTVSWLPDLFGKQKKKKVLQCKRVFTNIFCSLRMLSL